MTIKTLDDCDDIRISLGFSVTPSYKAGQV